MPDFIPPADPAKIIWLNNLKTKIAGYAATLGITAARIAQIIAWCDDLIAKINAAAQAKRDWLSTSAAQATQEKTSIAGLRGEIALWKPQPGMTNAIEADLKIVGTTTPFNPDTYKATITSGEAFSGYNRLKFLKAGGTAITFTRARKARPCGSSFHATPIRPTTTTRRPPRPACPKCASIKPSAS